MPAFADRVDELADWDQIKLLTVAVNRLERWHRPGLLCIGDAAHAMSPIGGVGVNLAVQDAVAAANILWRPLKDGTLREDDLDYVQERREFPTRVTQRMQVFMQDKVIDRALGDGKALEAPLPLRLMSRFALLRRIPARLSVWACGREHVHTPDCARRGGVAGLRPLIREVFRLELDRHAVRRAVGGMVPGVAVARERGRVGHALLGDDALERVEPVPVIGLAGVGIAGRLRALDLVRQGRRPFGPGEQPARVQRERHREGLRLPRLAEHRAFRVARDARAPPRWRAAPPPGRSRSCQAGSR